MAYIGREPQIGNFQVCDAISVVNAQAAYTMQVSSANVIPESVNHMVVSLNGVIQKPGSSYTIASATITFSRNLVTGETIDFIYLLGNVLDLGTPSDDTVTGAKIVDNAINSEHYTNASIDLAHMSANSIDSDQYVNGSIDHVHLAGDAVDGDNLADDAVDSEHYTDGSIDTAHLADGQVTIGKLATAVLTGATDIGAAIVDADLLLVDDGAGGTLRKTAASRLKTYIGSTGKILSITSLGDVGSLSQASTNSTDFADLGNLELQITPLASGSKFNIFINYNIDTGGDSHGLNVRLMFNHSGISHSEVNDRYGQSNTEVVADRINVWQSQNYFLAPNTTNEITFNLQIAAASSGQNTHFNRGTCSMIIMEYA